MSLLTVLALFSALLVVSAAFSLAIDLYKEGRNGWTEDD